MLRMVAASAGIQAWWFEIVQGGMECPCQNAWIDMIPFLPGGEAHNWDAFFSMG